MYFETEALEFNKILQKISQFANSERTKAQILEIKPSNDIDFVNRLLNETDETRRFIASFGSLPLGSSKDVYPYISLASKGGILNEEELLYINDLIKTSIQIKKTKQSLSNQFKFEYTNKYIDELIDLSKLSLEINRCIDDTGVINDNASLDLLKIRKSIRLLEAKLKNKLTELISIRKNELVDSNIVIRNDRLCLCVKVEYKNTFKGIIHDQSSSGLTVYIEPQATYEINNELLSTQNEEKQEIARILAMLSGAVLSYSNELLSNLNNIIYLDILNAKAKYGIDDALPKINDLGIIKLENAIHPLLDKTKAVPLTINLGDKYQTIIITGPNTGGKTVTLKTVGLLTLMAQSGILVPAKKAEIAIFDDVFSDIGDEQSIEQSLSTFSSHMKKIVNITNNISENSLVLLDELGGGTDPVEGSALAISLLNYFMDKNARVIITTHYPTLKEYGYENDKILNASMEFNETTYMPTYKLLLGISGKSNAFLISKHLGLDENIIENANNYLYDSPNNDSSLMKKIEEQGLYYNQLIEENEKIKNEIIKDKLEYERKIRDLESKKEIILKKAQKQADDIYKEAKEKSEDLIKEIEALRNEKTKENEFADVKHKIKGLKITEEVIINEHELSVGDYVEIIPYECKGEITKIKGNKYTVVFGNLTKDFELKDLKFSSTKPKQQPIKSNYVHTTRAYQATLDLRGYRYEDAKIALDKFIDDAICAKLPFVTIIHGYGTGVIRALVQDYLKNCKYISSFKYGGQGAGLMGSTVAYLK